MTFEELRKQEHRVIEADVYNPPTMTYTAFRAGDFTDNCGHKHKTYQAAEKCAFKCGATHIQALTTGGEWEYTQ